MHGNANKYFLRIYFLDSLISLDSLLQSRTLGPCETSATQKSSVIQSLNMYNFYSYQQGRNRDLCLLSTYLFLMINNEINQRQFRNSRLETFCKKLFLNKPEACDVIKKEPPTQAFSCKFSEIFKNTLFYRLTTVAASSN